MNLILDVQFVLLNDKIFELKPSFDQTDHQTSYFLAVLKQGEVLLFDQTFKTRR